MRPLSPVSAAMVAVVGLALTGCLDTTGLDDTHNPGPVTTPTGQVSGVALNVLTATMHAGNAFTPSAVVRDEHGIPVSGQPVNWYTTDTTVASVNGGGTIVAHRSGKVQISAALDKYSAMMVLDVAPPVTSPIILAPEQLSTLAGTAVTLQINDAGGAVVPTGTVVWTSSSPQVANIDYNGVVTARAAGTTIITATNDGSTAESQVTVSPAGVLTLAIDPGALALQVGHTGALVASLRDSSGDTVSGTTYSWVSSNTAVATIGADGTVTAVGTGTATMTVTATPSGGDPMTESAVVTVTDPHLPVASVGVAPTSLSVLSGETAQLTATAYDVSGNVLTGRSAAWATGNGAVATVSTSGLVTGVANGSTSITVTIEGQTATVPVTVAPVAVASVTINAPAASVVVGHTLQLTAAAHDSAGNVLGGRAIAWSSSSTAVATISPSGILTGVSPGTAVVTATSEGVHNTVSITVTPAPVVTVRVAPGSATLPIGSTVQLTATPYDASGTALPGRSVSWTVVNPSIAGVSNTGLVAALTSGSTTVTAMIEGVSASASITVSPAAVASVSVSPGTALLAPNATQQFGVTLRDAKGAVITGRTVSWSSSNSHVAGVSGSGLAMALSAGSATISATSGGVSGSASVTVTTPPTPTGGTVLGPKDNIQTAVNKYSGGTTFTLTAGIYRMQTVNPKDGDTFVGQPGAILSGARVLTQFNRSGSLWVAQGQDAPGRVNGVCLSSSPACQRPEDVFINNQLVQRVTSKGQVGAGKWFYDYGSNQIYIGDDPTNQLVEISVVPNAFTGAATRVTIRGIIIEKYDTPAQDGAIHGDNTDGWVVDGIEGRFNHGAAVKMGNRMQVLNSFLHHNGQEGIGGFKITDALVQGNEISYNNTAGFDPAWEAGGTKWSVTTNLTVRGNNSHHNHGKGLWTDIDNIGTLYENNTVTDNDGQGIFHEISYDAVIRNNDCERNGWVGWNASLSGAGILTASSPNVEMYGNTLIGNANGIGARQEARGSGRYGVYEVRNLYIHDNIVTMGNGASGVATMTGDNSTFTSKSNRFARNTYHYGSTNKRFTWMNNTVSSGQWQGYGQDTNGSFAP